MNLLDDEESQRTATNMGSKFAFQEQDAASDLRGTRSGEIRAVISVHVA